MTKEEKKPELPPQPFLPDSLSDQAMVLWTLSGPEVFHIVTCGEVETKTYDGTKCILAWAIRASLPLPCLAPKVQVGDREFYLGVVIEHYQEDVPEPRHSVGFELHAERYEALRSIAAYAEYLADEEHPGGEAEIVGDGRETMAHRDGGDE